MKNKISVIIPAYNEEKNLGRCIKYLNNSMKNIQKRTDIYIILNGCTDKTPEIAKKCKEKYKKLNIKILKSKLGKLNAQEKALKKIDLKDYVFFIDADVEVTKKSIKKIIKELDKHKKLIAVGGFPVAKKYKGYNLWKKFLDQILNIRSRHPKSEISKFDVKDYHPYAFTDPKKTNTSPKHESQSKIFFHGRIFALRSKRYWVKPKYREIAGDDSFIPDYITYNYGKGRIRIRYDALCYYNPFTSLINHYKAYKRIYYDLKNLKELYPKFKDIRKHSILILNKEYIKNQKFTTKIKFKLYSLIRMFERFLFKFSLNKDPKKLWN